MTDLFSAQLEREAAATRRALERVPEGRNDWKPHAKSMPLGYLASLIAKLPSWIAMMVELDDYELQPALGSSYEPQVWQTNGELLEMFDASLVAARKALTRTTDEHLMTNWRLLVAGHVVSEQPRHLMLADGVFSHLAHHRGQLTVYLRLNDVAVPELLYGPTADEGGFK